MRQIPGFVLACVFLLLPSAGVAHAKAAKEAKAPKNSGEPAQGSVKWFCGQFETASTKGTKSTKAGHAVQQCIELINSGVAQGRFQYSKDAAIKCAQNQTACAEVLTGSMASGGLCESSLDCAQPLVCIGPRGGAPGHCKKPLEAGAACDDEVGASHFFAEALSKRSVCAVGTHCQAKEGAADICVKD